MIDASIIEITIFIILRPLVNLIWHFFLQFKELFEHVLSKNEVAMYFGCLVISKALEVVYYAHWPFKHSHVDTLNS